MATQTRIGGVATSGDGHEARTAPCSQAGEEIGDGTATVRELVRATAQRLDSWRPGAAALIPV